MSSINNKNNNTDKNDLGVPESNVIDLRGNVESVDESPAPLPIKEKVVYKTEKSKDTSKINTKNDSTIDKPAKKIIKKPHSTPLSDRLEQWWWKVDVKGIVVFVILVLALTGVFSATKVWGQLNTTRGLVLGTSTRAYDYLVSAQIAIDEQSLSKAADEFSNAEEAFNEAHQQLDKLPGWMLGIIKLIPGPGDAVSSGEHLLKAGKYISQAGKSLTVVMQELQNDKAVIDDTKDAIDLLPLLEALNDDLGIAVNAAQSAIEELKHVKAESIPAEYRSQIESIKGKLPALTKELNSINSVVDLLDAVLGAQHAEEYLLIFQNNNEIRATGGFISSLAQVAVKQGSVNIVEVPGRGAYEVNDDFELKIIPPRPMWVINNEWQIQDANWWPDFPTSARKIIWFYETARGFPINGIVSFTPNIIIKLLDITGPVDMTDKYAEIVTANNFLELIQNIDYDKQENQPKALVADLMPEILNRLLNIEPANLLDTLAVINQALAEKHMIFYFTDNRLEQIARNLDWAGEVKTTPYDYLSVVHANIGGGKTDLIVENEIEHKSSITSDGKIINTVSIIKRHNGNSDDEITNVKNMDYLRILVPQGSELIEAIGFETINNDLILYPDQDAIEDEDLKNLEGNIVVHESSGTRMYEQFDKTVFANWLGVEVGETAIASITYKLPNLYDGSVPYTLLLQKQAGTEGDPISSQLEWSSNFKLSTYAPDNGVQSSDKGLEYNSILNVDRAWGAVLKRHKD
ncbi:DUF4012 domain-containing protein [Patescibacteria group bacterium]